MDAARDRHSADLPPEVCAALAEEAPIGVFLVQDGAVIHANRWLREFSGYEPGPGAPLDVLEAIHPGDRPLVARQMKLRLAGAGAQESYQVRLIRRDGGVRTVQIHAKAAAHQGRPAIQGALVDVTDQAGVERALCETVARMEESNRLRLLFSDILCHDLTNPVWVAENYVRLLAGGELTEGQRPLCAGAGHALAKAREILADARTYLKLDGRVAAPPERVNLAVVVEAAAARLRPLWEEKGQSVSFALDAGAEVDGGPLLLDLAWHLLANAIKYGPPRSAVEVAVAAGERVRLEVRDRGPGVAEQERERIFRRFESQEKGSVTGVGLGLSIARRVARLHGGALWVEANPAGGSVFVAEFPAARPGAG